MQSRQTSGRIVSRKSHGDSSLHKRSWVFTILISVFFGGLLYSVYYFFCNEFSVKLWAVDSVVVQGNYSNVDPSSLKDILKQDVSGDLLSLSVAKVGNSIAALPWVKSVQVFRQLPHTVVVNLQQRDPVAIYNNNMFIDNSGQLFSNYNLEKDAAPLVKLNGPTKESRSMILHEQVFSEILSAINLQVATVNLGDSLSWEVDTSNGIKLFLGQKDEIDRIVRFVNSYSYLVKENKNTKIDYVDLRYPYGFAVKWQNKSS
jgi:cell division protein FtsQ